MDAECAYRVLERFADTSLIEVRLHTGKRNQIRIQARLRGHTLVGETALRVRARRAAADRRSRGRRCTRTGWRSGIRPMTGRSSSRRLCRTICLDLLTTLRETARR